MVTQMAEPEIFYDELGDTLYISFAPGKTGTGLELNDHILLRVDKQHRCAIGITLVSFSILVNRSEIGARSVPLSGFDELRPELRELALELLHSPPVSEYLTVMACPPGEIPSVMVNTEKLVARVA